MKYHRITAALTTLDFDLLDLLITSGAMTSDQVHLRLGVDRTLAATERFLRRRMPSGTGLIEEHRKLAPLIDEGGRVQKGDTWSQLKRPALLRASARGVEAYDEALLALDAAAQQDPGRSLSEQREHQRVLRRQKYLREKARKEAASVSVTPPTPSGGVSR